MQTITLKNRVQVIDYVDTDVHLELPAYFKDKVTGRNVYAIAEDERIVEVFISGGYYHMTVVEKGDSMYSKALNNATQGTPTTEDHFFEQRDRFMLKLMK